MGVSGCIVCGSVGGWSGRWVISDRRALENIKGSITTVKIKLGTACPDLQPRSDQTWPWQRWIILWRWIQELLVSAFGPRGLFFQKELLGGFLARQTTATACQIPESFQALSRFCYIGAPPPFFYSCFSFSLMRCLFWFPVWIKNVIFFSLASGFNSSLFLEIMSYAFLTDRQPTLEKEKRRSQGAGVKNLSR